MTNDEIEAERKKQIGELVKQARLMEASLQLYLSDKQVDWLYDLVEHYDKGNFEAFGNNSVDFLKAIVRGYYSTYPN